MAKQIPGWVYILKCSDNSYYVGSTTDLVTRMNEHIMGIFKGYTSNRLPIELMYSESFSTVKEAMNVEKQLKGWTRKKKESLIRGDLSYFMNLQSAEIRHRILDILQCKGDGGITGYGQ